ncbi:MAG: hypothetical protein AB1454_11620 [Candidatus Auribacterota bacterium]
MKRFFCIAGLIGSIACFVGASTGYGEANREWDNLYEIPNMPEGTLLFDHEKIFAYRGRIGYFVLPPSAMGCFFDSSVNYEPPEKSIRKEKKEKDNDSASKDDHLTGVQYFGIEGSKDKEIWHENESIKIMFRRKVVGKSFCGAYLMILGDISKYATVTFMIKGEKGGETFQIGMNDAVSNKREDAVFIGSIGRFLPDGITRDWQMVKIPVESFFGPDLQTVMSIVFDVNEETEGTVWIDDLRFYHEPLVFPMKDIYEKGFLLLDNFDFNYLNLMGRKSNTYKNLPSVCSHELDTNVFYGDKGKSLRIDYDKKGTGWCGYYTLLNQIDGSWYDLSEFNRVSFMVKGKRGGEDFEIGMADKNWVIIGDSLKAGNVTKYLPNGITTEWQEVVIPLADFGLLDFTEMGSFVINFNKKQTSTIWIDDLKFHIKQEEEKEPDWEDFFGE